jgi:hypothetical protein
MRKAHTSFAEGRATAIAMFQPSSTQCKPIAHINGIIPSVREWGDSCILWSAASTNPNRKHPAAQNPRTTAGLLFDRASGRSKNNAMPNINPELNGSSCRKWVAREVRITPETAPQTPTAVTHKTAR